MRRAVRVHAELPADTPQDLVELTSRCLKKDKTTRPTAAELLHAEPLLTWARRRAQEETEDSSPPADTLQPGKAALDAASDGSAQAPLAATTDFAPAETAHALTTGKPDTDGNKTEGGGPLDLQFTRGSVPPGLRQLFQWRTHTLSGGSASSPLWQSVDALVGQEVVAMGTGRHATAVVSAAGEIYAWRAPGSDTEATFASKDRPTRLSAASSVVVISAALADEVLLMLDVEGHVWRWLAEKSSPVLMPGLPQAQRVTSVGCGSEHCVVCIDDGRVFSWGSNDEGQLGVGDCNERDSPCVVELPDGELARAVCCAAESTFVLTTSSNALSCGSDDFRQLGLPASEAATADDDVNDEDDTTMLRWMAMPASVESKLVQISCGAQHGAALTSDGRVVTWGNPEAGRLGRKRMRGAADASYARPATVAIPIAGQNVVAVSAAGAHTVAVSSSGALWLWGRACPAIKLG